VLHLYLRNLRDGMTNPRIPSLLPVMLLNATRGKGGKYIRYITISFVKGNLNIH
jgi:hypothetical protein